MHYNDNARNSYLFSRSGATEDILKLRNERWQICKIVWWQLWSCFFDKYGRNAFWQIWQRCFAVSLFSAFQFQLVKSGNFCNFSRHVNYLRRRMTIPTLKGENCEKQKSCLASGTLRGPPHWCPTLCSILFFSISWLTLRLCTMQPSCQNSRDDTPTEAETLNVWCGKAKFLMKLSNKWEIIF